MKLIPLLFAAVLMSTGGFAQDPAVEPLPEGGTDPAGLTEPLPLIPEEPPTVEKPARGGRRPKTTARKDRGEMQELNTSGTAEAIALRIRYREVKTVVLRDASVQAELKEAARVPTDFERREAMKRHYALLFGKMEKIDPSLKPLIEARHATVLARIRETRIEPTHPPIGYDRPVEVSAGSPKKRS